MREAVLTQPYNSHCTGIMDHKPQSGAFQLYTAAHSKLTSKIPATMRFVDAAVLPLAISTAAMGLFGKDYLALPAPSSSSSTEHSSGGGGGGKGLAILVWGGSSSVGATAIQLAKASGLTVLAAASSRNFDALKLEVGADYVFDYKSDSVVADIVATVQTLHEREGIEFVGIYDAISETQTIQDAARPILDELKSKGVISAKRMALVLPPPPDLPGDYEAKSVYAALLLPGHGYDDVTRLAWEEFVPAALASGTLKPLPPPLVVVKGLEAIQIGIDLNKEGVSYKKVVVDVDL
jgi:NADPH:quinone reductase-like Zn-dependent oxidoreductase